MFKRILASIIGLPLLIVIVSLGGAFFYIAVTLVSIIGINEFYNAFSNKEYTPFYSIGYLSSFLIMTLFFFDYSEMLLPLLAIIFFICSLILLAKDNHSILDIMITFFGIIYISIMIGHMILSINSENAIGVWLIFIIAWATDTFAYFSGVYFGKRKLCPKVSPKKTLEGSVGGILGSVIATLIFGNIFVLGSNIMLLFLGIIGSILSQAGDLFASKIKRYVEIKDFGKLIPGHGGILDRFDSIIFVSPIVFYYLNFIIQ
ncbi:phosphatidate cytidylyltransferase [Serpentinicella sp. ANB-PHB4]|uniref:phosphatidate cytidylyltransferase n=1 Tax=Serpentinicella sp. ANB-PHB4 TaxID=3074076 RepID=UPI0028558B78|nr:phosphatidate cytidylyltransferase [Serpentinicella sp. ANB-PHB4]MDR5658230.1 phosphatidate cytidylyltransferase [Serpentinicella sp. ANB-PHB4]